MTTALTLISEPVQSYFNKNCPWPNERVRSRVCNVCLYRNNRCHHLTTINTVFGFHLTRDPISGDKFVMLKSSSAKLSRINVTKIQISLQTDNEVWPRSKWMVWIGSHFEATNCLLSIDHALNEVLTVWRFLCSTWSGPVITKSVCIIVN